MAATDEPISGPFYHGTKADLKPGDLISPGYRSNYGHAERTSPWVYMTATLSPLGAELARGDGPGRLYIVEPTGPFVDDPDLTDKKFPGNPTKSYRSRYPLRVVGEVTDWEPSSPEQIQAMLDGQARIYAMQAERIARIPSASEFDRIRAQADERAREWTPTPEYLGCMLLMLIRGAEVEVYSAVSYRSEARAETRTFELPRPIDVRPGWLPGEVPLSGRITDVGAWREGWVAVIESCVTEIGLSLEARIWVAVDADHDTLRFRVDADGPERSWQRNLELGHGVLTDTEHGEIWDFRTDHVPDVSDHGLAAGIFVGEGELPAEFDRVNWGALGFAPIWALLYGPRRWLLAFIAFIGLPILIDNIALLAFDSSVFHSVHRVTSGTTVLFPLLAAAYAVTVNKQVWERERRKFEAEAGMPADLIPLWRYRKSTRFWTRLFVIVFALGWVLALAALVTGRVSPSAALIPGLEDLTVLAVFVYDRVRRARLRG